MRAPERDGLGALLRGTLPEVPRRYAEPLIVAASLTLLAVVPFLLYWPVLDDFFALDDFMWLKAASNPDASDYFRRAFSFSPAGAFDATTPFWRPTVDAYFFVAWRIFGLDPLPYHVVNVLLHGAIASLVAVLVWQITSSKVNALATGLLFAVLPTYDFAVTWISSVTELALVLFYISTLVLFAGYLRTSRRWLHWAALAAFLLALLSKESAATLPVAVAGVAFVVQPPRGRQALAERVRELLPFVAVTSAYGFFLYIAEYRGKGGGLYQFGPHGFGNLWDYLKWMTLPLPDSWASWVPQARSLTAAGFLALGLVFVALGNRYLALMVAWTLVALLPYAFFPAGIEYRYTYLASIPLAALAVGLLRAASGPLERLTARRPAAFVLALFFLAAVSLLATQARDRQEWISSQAAAYDALFHQVPAICGDLSPGSHIFLLSPPHFDLFGNASRMAMNMRYDSVYVGLIEGERPPGLAAFIEDKCVLEYDPGLERYIRIE